MCSSPRRTQMGLAALILAVAPVIANAQLVFDAASSSVSFRHTEDAANPNLRRNTRVLSFLDASAINTFDFTNLFSLGNSNTNSKAGVDPITNSTTGSFRLPTGTGVTQSNPSGQYSSFSELQLSFDLRWNVGPGGTTTSLLPYSSYGIAGTVGQGGYAKLIQALTVQNLSASNTVLRTADLNATVDLLTAGPFSQTVTRSAAFSGGTGPLAAGTKLVVSGTIKFRAKNDLSPSDIKLIDGELGGQSNLYTGQFGATGSWQDSANWAASADLPPNTFPNGPVRARLISTDLNTDSHTITLNAPVSVNELEIDDLDNYTINSSSPTDTLTLNAAQPRLHIGNGNGNAQVVVNAPIAITAGSTSADLASDSTGGLILNGKITAPAASTLTIHGKGPVILNGNNSTTLVSPVTISGDSVTSNSTGALGSGQLRVAGGRLIANSNHPSTFAGDVLVEQKGQYVFGTGVIPQPTESFDVDDSSAISGTPSQLNALSTTGNITLQPGAMIVHTSLTPLVAPGQDVQNLGTVPKYIYGIGNDFVAAGTNLSINGSGTSPYLGLGSDRSARIFGNHPNAGNGPSNTLDALTLSGSTVLAAMPGGQLTLNTRLLGSGTVQITGGGTILVNNLGPNTFNGQFHITDGALVLRGGLGGNGNISSILLEGENAVFGGFAPNDTPVEVVRGTIHPDNLGLGSLSIDSLNLSGGSLNSVLKFTCDRPGSNDYLLVTGPIAGQARLDLDVRAGFDVGLYELMRYQQGAPSVAINLGNVPPDFSVDFAIVPDAAGSPIGRGILVVAPTGVAKGNYALNTNANFSNPAAWNGPVPSGVSSVANFGPVNTGPVNVTLDTPRTLGTLNFYSPQTISVAGSATLTIDGVLGQAGINSATGGHVVSTPIHFAHSAVLNAQGGGISLQGNMTADSGVTLYKRGISGLGVKHFRVDRVEIEDGAVSIAFQPTNNSAVGASLIKSLFIGETPVRPAGVFAGPPNLNLANNALMIDYDGESPIAAIRQYLRNGITNSGPRIYSFISAPMPALPVRSLRLFETSELGLTTFAGQSFDSSTVLVAYSIAGDANLDYTVNLFDFTRLAANFGTSGDAFDGDSNFDGLISLADFTALAVNFGLSLPSETPNSLPASAVPEPAATVLLLATCLIRGRFRLEKLQ